MKIGAVTEKLKERSIFLGVLIIIIVALEFYGRTQESLLFVPLLRL